MILTSAIQMPTEHIKRLLHNYMKIFVHAISQTFIRLGICQQVVFIFFILSKASNHDLKNYG